MIASTARLAAPISRHGLRQSGSRSASLRKPSPVLRSNFAQRRHASGSASDKIKEAAETVKSKSGDAPWAIGSVLFFGSLFVYLTSPPSGGKNGHAHGHKDPHEGDSAYTDDGKSAKGTEGGSDYFVPKKIEDKPEEGSNAPPGSHALAQRSMTAEEGAHRQKVTKEGSSGRADDITFKKGISAAKEGHSGKEDSHISDPKKVVAAAHEERDKRSQASKGAKDKIQGSTQAADEHAKPGKDDSDDVENSTQAADANSQNEESDEDREHSEAVHNSPQAADANAQNENSDEDQEDSKKVHDSENARKANEINEAEGSDKPDDDE